MPESGHLKSYGLDGKGLRALDKLQGRAISVLSPSLPQKDLPTSRPKKANVKGKVIDGVAAARVCTSDVVIAEDSYAIIGTDREFLHARVYLQKRFDTRPRRVVGKPAIGYIDQSALKDMAKQFTKPRPTSAYVDPEIVKKAFREARIGKTADLWKAAVQQRGTARSAWEEEHLQRASEGEWEAIKSAREVSAAWEAQFAEATVGKPHETVHTHLEEIYKGRPFSEWKPDHVDKVQPFSVEELRQAADKGWQGKAVGPDGVPRELLQYRVARCCWAGSTGCCQQEFCHQTGQRW